MDALPLSSAECERRSAAGRRLDDLSDSIRWVGAQISAAQDCGNVSRSPLALAARAGWMYAQVALIQAEGGMHSRRMIDAIAEPGVVDSPALRSLSLSTLMAAEARISGEPPMPAALALGGGR